MDTNTKEILIDEKIAQINEQIKENRNAYERLTTELASCKKQTFNKFIGNVYDLSYTLHTQPWTMTVIYVMDIEVIDSQNVSLIGPMISLTRSSKTDFHLCDLIYEGKCTISDTTRLEANYRPLEDFAELYKIAVQMMNATFLPILDGVISDSEAVELKLQ